MIIVKEMQTQSSVSEPSALGMIPFLPWPLPALCIAGFSRIV